MAGRSGAQHRVVQVCASCWAPTSTEGRAGRHGVQAGEPRLPADIRGEELKSHPLQQFTICFPPPTPPRDPRLRAPLTHSPLSFSCLSRCLVGSGGHKRAVSTGQETAAPDLGPQLAAPPAHQHQPKVHSSWPPATLGLREAFSTASLRPQMGPEAPLLLCGTQ